VITSRGGVSELICAEDSRTSEAAGVSSDGKVWVMYQLSSVAVPSSVAGERQRSAS
jgi:hypothetical protein